MDEKLTVSDRCDGKQCGAQAFVRVQTMLETLEDIILGELDFCAHHYNKNADELFLQGFTVAEDLRDTINQKPSLSASNV